MNSSKGSWQFDVGDARRLLCGYRVEEFWFEKPVCLYLLTVWLLWPDNSRRQRNAARRLGMLITFCVIGDNHQPRDARIRKPKDVAKRMNEDWFLEFYKAFLQPLGGLSFFHIRSADSLRALVQTRLVELRAELDYIKFVFEELSAADCAEPDRRSAIEALRSNRFNRPSGYYYNAEPGTSAKSGMKTGLHAKSGELRWDRMPVSLIGLYAFQTVFPELLELDPSRRSFLKDLWSASLENERLIAAFTLHDQIVRGIQRLKDPANRLELMTRMGIPSPNATDAVAS